MKTRLRHFALLLLVALGATGCSVQKFYSLNGAALDYNVYKTISFGEFPIRAALVYPPLQQFFENKLMDMATQQTRLRMVDNVNSDLRMEGEITTYSLSPQAVGDNAYATRTRLTIAVRVRYTDNRNPALCNDFTVSAYRDFDASQMLTDVQDDLCNQISTELADLIFNQTLGNW